MINIGENIKKYRKSNGMTQQKLADAANISRSYLGDIENNRYNPSIETIKNIVSILGITMDEFFSEQSDYKSIELTKKDERDIKKDIDRAIESLTHDQDGLMFDGEIVELDEETKEFLKTSLENTMRLAKQKAKAKFTPNKYRK